MEIDVCMTNLCISNPLQTRWVEDLRYVCVEIEDLRYVCVEIEDLRYVCVEIDYTWAGLKLASL